MITRTAILPEEKVPRHLDELSIKKEQLLFFDIETTGLAADASSLYLIGCCFYMDDKWQLFQWFADDYQSEEKMLKAFIKCILKHPLLIHYNGEAFDIKYLKKKAEGYGIDFPKIIKQKEIYTDYVKSEELKSKESKSEKYGETGLKREDNAALSEDLYQHMKCFKKLCGIGKLSLKDAELLLNIKREDIFSGKELLSVYCDYMKLNILSKKNVHKEEEPLLPDFDSGKIYSDYDYDEFWGMLKEKDMNALFDQMLLHNYEDVLNLIPLFDLTRTTELFFYSFFIWDMDKLSGHICWEEHEREKYLHGKDFLFPVNGEFLCIEDGEKQIELKLYPDGFCLLTKSVVKELKLFFPDYRNYYYLPAEDYSIHKSLGVYIDKDRREKSKPFNAYSRHNSEYLLVLNKKDAVPYTLKQHRFPFPVLFKDYESNLGYVRFTDLNDIKNIISYLKYIVGSM